MSDKIKAVNQDLLLPKWPTNVVPNEALLAERKAIEECLVEIQQKFYQDGLNSTLRLRKALAGTNDYYVATSSGGSPTQKVRFNNGVLSDTTQAILPTEPVDPYVPINNIPGKQTKIPE